MPHNLPPALTTTDALLHVLIKQNEEITNELRRIRVGEKPDPNLLVEPGGRRIQRTL